jgi:hypothetical protein
MKRKSTQLEHEREMQNQRTVIQQGVSTHP